MNRPYYHHAHMSFKFKNNILTMRVREIQKASTQSQAASTRHASLIQTARSARTRHSRRLCVASVRRPKPKLLPPNVNRARTHTHQASSCILPKDAARGGCQVPHGLRINDRVVADSEACIIRGPGLIQVSHVSVL
jgi:hypothetical protein